LTEFEISVNVFVNGERVPDRRLSVGLIDPEIPDSDSVNLQVNEGPR
jgi:hypothetical protein